MAICGRETKCPSGTWSHLLWGLPRMRLELPYRGDPGLRCLWGSLPMAIGIGSIMPRSRGRKVPHVAVRRAAMLGWHVPRLTNDIDGGQRDEV